MKYLLLALVIAIAVFAIAGRNRARRKGESPAPRGRDSAAPPQTKAMLVCSHCGVHLPDDEAMRDGAGRAYCSDAHRVAGPR